MKNEIAELNQLNTKIQANVAAQKRADQAQQEAEKYARINAALDACRVPVMVAGATWIAVAMGLAEFTLAWFATAPCLFWVAYQAGTTK